MRITKTLAILTMSGGIAYVAYHDEVSKKISDAFMQQTSIDTNRVNDNNSGPVDTQIKAQADQFIRQQLQQKLIREPEEDELSEREKLQMLAEALHELDTAEDEYDREFAVTTLGELNSAEAKQGLITALNDESDLVVFQAIRQINKWQNAGDRTEMLLSALQSHNDDVIEQTLRSISAVEDQKLIMRLKQLSKHANPDIREAAQLALNLAP